MGNLLLLLGIVVISLGLLAEFILLMDDNNSIKKSFLSILNRQKIKNMEKMTEPVHITVKLRAVEKNLFRA